jgi:hypothetical protein
MAAHAYIYDRLSKKMFQKYGQTIIATYQPGGGQMG